MSSTTCVPCEQALSCDDSPLSITGNVVGILTFAVALVLGAQAYFNSLRSARMDIYETVREMRGWRERLQYLDRTLSDRTQVHQDTEDVQSLMKRARDSAMKCVDFHNQLEMTLRDVGEKRDKFWRSRYLVRESQIRELRYKAEKAIQDFDKAANDVFASIESRSAEESHHRQQAMEARQEEMRDELRVMSLESMARLEAFARESIARSEDTSVRLQDSLAKIESLLQKLPLLEHTDGAQSHDKTDDST